MSTLLFQEPLSLRLPLKRETVCRQVSLSITQLCEKTHAKNQKNERSAKSTNLSDIIRAERRSAVQTVRPPRKHRAAENRIRDRPIPSQNFPRGGEKSVFLPSPLTKRRESGMIALGRSDTLPNIIKKGLSDPHEENRLHPFDPRPDAPRFRGLFRGRRHGRKRKRTNRRESERGNRRRRRRNRRGNPVRGEHPRGDELYRLHLHRPDLSERRKHLDGRGLVRGRDHWRSAQRRGLQAHAESGRSA